MTPLTIEEGSFSGELVKVGCLDYRIASAA
jgi:hypothetical protein